MEIAAAPQRSHRIIKIGAKRGVKIDARIGVEECAATAAKTGKITETRITMVAGVAEEDMVVVVAQIAATIGAKSGAKTGTTIVSKSGLEK
jgi:hypothetical protein